MVFCFLGVAAFLLFLADPFAGEESSALRLLSLVGEEEASAARLSEDLEAIRADERVEGIMCGCVVVCSWSGEW